MSAGPEQDLLPLGPLLRLFAVLVDVAATPTKSDSSRVETHGSKPLAPGARASPHLPPPTRPTGNDGAP